MNNGIGIFLYFEQIVNPIYRNSFLLISKGEFSFYSTTAISGDHIRIKIIPLSVA